MSRFDVIFILPYTFADHPSFPEGILKRSLEYKGFSVGIIDRPFWQKPESFGVLGNPKLFFSIISGPVDSIVLNYTSSRKRRIEDQYQIDGKGFFENYPPSIKYKIRPDNTIIVFANKIRQIYKETPIIIGGVEASLRQFAHYDFQKDKIRRSILFDSRANILVSGPGEKQIIKIAEQLREGKNINDLNLNGTSKIVKNISSLHEKIELPSFDDILNNKNKLSEAFLKKERGIRSGKIICQRNGDRYIVNYPSERYSENELDSFYSMPFLRIHSGSKKLSPALRMNLFSITSHRGCGGGCSFCSITLNEGKKIISRSTDSIIKEVRSLMDHPEWKGIISDVGGPSAEMYGFGCNNKSCGKNSCLFPKSCSSLTKGDRYRELLKNMRNVKGIKKIFIGSGVRFDNLMDNEELLQDILTHHSGKFLRIAPEHTQDHILTLMRKPSFFKLSEFMKLHSYINKSLKRKIDVSPYLIIGHPGETFEDIREMKKKIRSLNLPLEDIQIFTPTPGTYSTALYYSEITPDGNPIFVEKNINELVRRKNYLTRDK